jgi:acetolactate synthase I/II/III large subunit
MVARALGAEAHTIRSPEELINLDITAMCAGKCPTLL